MASHTRDVQSDTYHHGDLPNALRASAADLLAERGVGGFSLREVARRAGVSHAAPAHHFGDARGLLTSVAIEGFMHLGTQTEAVLAAGGDPVVVLARIGRAYVELAVAHPGHVAVMFRDDVVNCDAPEYQEWAHRPLAALAGAVERIAAERAPHLDVDLAVTTCWSMMQGLVAIYPTIDWLNRAVGRDVETIGDRAERQTHLLVAGLVAADA